MAWELNAKMKALSPYIPIEGEYKIRLDANESGYDLPAVMKAELAEEIASVAFNRYPDPYALEVCRAFANRFQLSPDFVTAGNGSDELISVIMGAMLQRSDTVLSLAPDFSMYRFYADIFELGSVVLEKDENLQIDVDTMIAASKANRAAAIILSNPCNPTSRIIAREDMLRLIASVESLVIVDEAYMDFADQSVLDVVGQYENLIVLKTCSKAVGMAAIRLGFAVAGKTLTHAIRAAKSPYNVNAISQAIGKVLLGHKDYLDNCARKIITQRQWLETNIKTLASQYPVLEAVYPSSTNFVLVKAKNAADIQRQLGECSIAIRLLGDFLRITAGTPDENMALIEALSGILSLLK